MEVITSDPTSGYFILPVAFPASYDIYGSCLKKRKQLSVYIENVKYGLESTAVLVLRLFRFFFSLK